MPTYVYGCAHKEHGRIEIIHGFTDDPTIVCNLCGETMHRIPQVFRHYHSPYQTLLDFMDKKYINWRTRRQKGLIKG